MPETTPIDQWVEDAKKGDTSAFGKIYDELVKPVYRYIFYRVEKETAEDLTEETFFKAWQNLRQYKKNSCPFSSWVFRIAHNLVVDHYRKNKPVDLIDENTANPETHHDPAHETNLKLTQIRLRKVIRRLPDQYQQVIVLRYINELNSGEIAQTLGKSEGAIRTLQCRALEKLRSLLSGEKDFM